MTETAGFFPETTFVPVGMRDHIDDPDGLVVNTCSDNGSALLGDLTHWSWSNPTNRRLAHHYAGVTAVSVECLWQGTKMMPEMVSPNSEILGGNWRLMNGRRPLGAWAGEGEPLITDPGQARRLIYLPAYLNLILFWLENGADEILIEAASYPTVYLRDFDTGRGLDRNGAMSHAWVLSYFLNNKEMPK